MKTVAVISQKGGAGKTTLCVHLAAAAAAAGRIPLLVDTDPQATASRWGSWRAGREPEVVDCGAPSLLAGKLAKAASLGAELVVIDTPPHADAMARQAAALADLILVPCRPKAFDLAAIETTADLVKSMRKGGFVVFMAGPPRAPVIYREAGELITGLDDDYSLSVAPVILPERAAYHYSTAEGAAAQELDPDGKAAREIGALWEWTCLQLAMPVGSPLVVQSR